MYGIPKACWLLAHATLRLLSQCCHSDESLRDYTFHLQQDVELPEVVPWWNLAMPPVFTCFHESTNGSTIDSSNFSLQLCYDLSQSYDVVGPCQTLSGLVPSGRLHFVSASQAPARTPCTLQRTQTAPQLRHSNWQNGVASWHGMDHGSSMDQQGADRGNQTANLTASMFWFGSL